MPRQASSSLPHHLDDDPLAALAVELGIIDLLPRAKIEFSLRYGGDHFMVHEEALEMRVAVRLPRPVMVVVQIKRRKPLEPCIDVLDKTVFSVINIDGGRDMHRGYKNHSFCNAGMFHDLL